jgi:S-adenosylmethionine:tRNA ribosyltransferase-isomerase
VGNSGAMQLSDFDFELPQDRIALRPAEPRDSARLLVVRPGQGLEDQRVRDLPALLRAGDILVVNETRVIPARLKGRRSREGSDIAVEATLHQRISGASWRAFMRPGKKIRAGDRLLFAGLGAAVAEKGRDGEFTLEFDCSGPELDAAIDRVGEMPLPPYIASKRNQDERDRTDYQTVFARREGSVAAPTAGLHFTPELLARLQDAGVGMARVTLHVGAGTFLPVKTEDLAQHRMHAEWGEITPETADQINAARAAGGRVICVGTTSLRLLESAAGPDGVLQAWTGETDIFITPGRPFRIADGLMTNFHLPKSTLFMLVSALSGLEVMKAAYAHAIAEGYRFYSYGDSSLLWRAG